MRFSYQMVRKTLVFLSCFALLNTFLLVFSALAQNRPLTPPVTIQEGEQEQPFSIRGLRNAFKDNVDAKVRIAENLRRVAENKMDARAFYRELSQMDLGGQEARHVLMDVKKTIQEQMGDHGLGYFFGELYQNEGGSYVEMKLLSWRKEVVYQKMKGVVQKFRGQNIVDGVKYTVYLAEVGNWVNETPRQHTFAGDIDIAIICGNLELSLRIKGEFDSSIKADLDITAEAFDTPCTAHGMATEEVFVGKSGQAFAEGTLKEVKKIDLDSGEIGKVPVPFQEALFSVLTEAKFAKKGLAHLAEIKWPTEPGISLEMIRHFEHDIIGKNVFNELDSFMKATKYVERSGEAVKKEGGTPADEALTRFAEELVATKKLRPGEHDIPKARSDLIKQYFDSIGKPLPFSVDLKPTRYGQSQATLRANEKLIKEFWETCRQAMWENAIKGSELRLDQAKKAVQRTSGKKWDDPEVRKVANELDSIREMIEVEFRVLEDPHAGVKEIPPKLQELRRQINTEAQSFFKKHGKNLLPANMLDSYKFIDEQLSARQPISRKFGIAALLSVPENINKYLDFMDDTLLSEIRGESGGEYNRLLTEARELRWLQKVDEILNRSLSAGKSQKIRISLAEGYANLEKSVNEIVINNFATRGLQQVNQTLSRSIQSSRAGQVTMQALLVVNLAQELPVYIQLFAEGEWRALATEFFRRRVPGGSSVENIYMGRYLQAGWDMVVVLVPPTALLAVAESIGEEMGKRAWDLYWSEELNKFIDGLYKNATFSLQGVEHYEGKLKLSRWRLEKVKYQDKGIDDVYGFVRKKAQQIAEMKQQLKRPLSRREFPMEYTLDGITGWFHFNDMLRVNIAANDPWLLMIEEMKKNPHVGRKLFEHFQDLWFTRWEEVKLEYVKHMIKMLEDRRSAEQAEISGQFPEMVQELERISTELKIRDKVNECLKEEMGGIVWKLYAWLCDYLKGIKREFLSEPGIWTDYQEGIRIVHKYLRAYKAVLEGRKKTEEQYFLRINEDLGVRILTGLYFLKGSADVDFGKEGQWIALRPQLETGVISELENIKGEYVENRTLEPDPKSFDQQIKGEITDHDFWREAWKYVHSTGQPEALGVLSSEYQSVRESLGLVKAEGPSAQDTALQRHRYHKEEHDRLVAKFRMHYYREDKASLNRLDHLVREIERLSAEIVRLCAMVQSGVPSIGRDLIHLESEVSGLERRLTPTYDVVSSTAMLKGRLEELHKNAENAAAKVGEKGSELERLSVEICEEAKRIKDARPASRRQQLFARLQGKKSDIRSRLSEANTECKVGESAGRSAQEIAARITDAEAQFKQFPDITNSSGRLGSARGRVSPIREAIDKASQKRSELENTKAEAEKLLEKLFERARKLGDSEEAKKMKEELDNYETRIAKAVAAAPNCVATNTLDKYSAQMADLETRISRLMANRDACIAAFGVGGSAKGLRQKVEMIEYVISLAKSYLERCNKAATDGAFCLTLAEDASNKQDELDKSQCVHWPGSVPILDQSNRVSCICPSEKGLAWNRDKTACIDYRQAAIENTDCSRWPRSIPQWNNQTNRAECFCPQGLTWNRDRTMCIDARQAAVEHTDCSRWPGSVPMWNNQTNRAECFCPQGFVWNRERTACISAQQQQGQERCQKLANALTIARDRKDINQFRTLLAQARDCGFYNQALADLQRMEQEISTVKPQPSPPPDNRRWCVWHDCKGKKSACWLQLSPENEVPQTGGGVTITIKGTFNTEKEARQATCEAIKDMHDSAWGIRGKIGKEIYSVGNFIYWDNKEKRYKCKTKASDGESRR